MSQKQFCKTYNLLFLFIIYFLFIGIVNGKELPSPTIKPEKPNRIQFIKKGERRIYHVLDSIDSSLTYHDITKNTESDINDDEKEILRIKIRARALNRISSSKWSTFGINIIKQTNGETSDTTHLRFRTEIDRKIKYEKDEKLFISRAGRWFFDVSLDTNLVSNSNNPRDTIDFVIEKSSDKNDSICVRVNVQKIQHKKIQGQKGESGSIPTIDHSIIHYVDAEYTGQLFEYYGLNMDDKRKEHQFKIRGPMKVRVYNRPEELGNDKSYSINLREDGLPLGKYKIDAYNQGIDFPETASFYFTVPKGEYFYTISSDEKIFIRLRKYREAQNK